MTKEEMNQYLESIGGLVRTYKVFKGPILTAEYLTVSEGWYDIIKSLIDELMALGWDRRVHQVKEKLGGLRFYVENIPEGGEEIIRKYESLSYKLCEKCGNEGQLRGGNGQWLRTLCEEHAEGREIYDINLYM
jgi:hypothetical protein